MDVKDLVTIGVLVFMEGLLSMDNALVLAMMVKDLPERQQKKALTYGMAGAFGFRFLALLFITSLMQWVWVKFIGGFYLVFLAAKHFVSKEEEAPTKREVSTTSFVALICMVELTDIAFSMDSILAAVALTQKFWVVFVGGVLGIMMMRLAASLFVGLLERFPKLQRTAYLLVGTVGTKLILDGFHIPAINFHSTNSPAFWVFWGLMAVCILTGFLPDKITKEQVLKQRACL